MIRIGHVLLGALLLAGVASCKKSASAEKGPAVQGALKAKLPGKEMGPLYGVAQLDPLIPGGHRLDFSTQKIDCATPATADRFWISVQPAPDGGAGWHYGGIAFGSGGSAPANPTAMVAYKVSGARVTGTLPADVSTPVEGGELVVTGDFSVPMCGK